MNITDFVARARTQEMKEASAYMENMMMCVYGVEDLIVKEIDLKPEDYEVTVYTRLHGIDSLIRFPMCRVFGSSLAYIEVYFGDLPDEVPECLMQAICRLRLEMGIYPLIRNRGLAISISIKDVSSAAEIANAYKILCEHCHGLAELLAGNVSELLVPSGEDAIHCAASKEIN